MNMVNRFKSQISNLKSEISNFKFGSRIFSSVLVATLGAATARAGESASFALDTRGGVRAAALDESIRWSSAWVTALAGAWDEDTNPLDRVTAADLAGAVAVVTVDGETIASGNGSGAVSWRPSGNGTFTLEHRVYDAKGAQIGETLSAKFSCDFYPEAPVVTPNGGIVATWPVSVSISCATAGATIYYTTDGSEPTENSTKYRKFRVTQKTVVKAVAVKEGLASGVVSAGFALGICETPTISAVSKFSGSKTDVTITCGTVGAKIRYTLDGSEPGEDSAIYEGPVAVTQSCTVKARAMYDDWLDSDVASFDIEKIWGIGDTFGEPDLVFTTGGDSPFFRVEDSTAERGEAMQSGAISDSEVSTLATTVDGAGEVSFLWRASTEDSSGFYDWDRAEFLVDGEIVAQIDGETEWEKVSANIAGAGAHTLLWRYIKDESESGGDDYVRLAGLKWVPDTEPDEPDTVAVGDVEVPVSWLEEHAAEIVEAAGGDFEAAANATAANGRPVWECYVADLDPSDPEDDLKVGIEMRPDGTPDVKILSGEKATRVYETQGAPEPSGPWGDVSDNSRFFRVKVRLP